MSVCVAVCVCKLRGKGLQVTLETEPRLPSVGSEMTLKKSQKLYKNILNKKLILALILTLTVLLQLHAVVM